MNKIANLLPKVAHIFDQHNTIIKPKMIVGEDFESAIEYLEYNLLYEDYSILGTDCIGGLAYFGLNKDIADIKQQADKYLEYFSKIPQDEDLEWEGKFYALWEINDYSLLILYEDYQDELDNPYPSNSNVLFTKFGAWVSDYLLSTVLNLSEEEQNIHGAEWLIGKEEFDSTNISHVDLLNNFKAIMKVIYPTYDDSEDFDD